MTIPRPGYDFLQKLKEILFRFLWSDKPDKVKRALVTQDYKDGGLRMVNIQLFIQSTKLTWIRRLFRSPSTAWVKLFEKTISPLKKMSTFGSKWCEKIRNRIENPFWKETLDS